MTNPMNKSEIGIQELREKLATQVMGWELTKCGALNGHLPVYDLFTDGPYIPSSRTNSGNKFIMRAYTWQPDIDRNQTALLLGKITDTNQQSKIIEKLAPHPAILGYALRHMWDVLAAEPETICRAILEVMSQEPTQ